jgi:type III secretory pathway component EscV
MAVGAATVMEGRSAIIDGFGLIALVALAPILSVILLGMIYRKKEEKDDGDGA